VIRTVEIRTTVPYLIVTASWLTDSKMTGGLVSTGDHRLMHALSREVGSFSEFRSDCRQPGHYTRFGITSGLPVTRAQPERRLLPF
jgi:hypothetical protein